MQRSRYSELLTHYPALVLAVILVVVCSCAALNFFVGKPPDFSDPLEGFIPRYSALHGSYYAWSNLIEQTAIGSEPTKLLTTYPRLSAGVNNCTGLSISSSSTVMPHDLPRREIAPSDVPMTSSHLLLSSTVGYFSNGEGAQSKNLTDEELFFCDSRPREGYIQVAFTLPLNFSHLHTSAFYSLCSLQTLIESLATYTPACQQGCFCRSFSLVNYMTYLAGKESCDEMTASEVTSTVQLTLSCRRYFVELADECWEQGGSFGRECNVSSECAHKSMYDIYYYILSKDTTLTISYLHMAKSRSVYPLYLGISEIIELSKQDTVKPIALDMGLKEYVFEKLLLTDSLWILLALCIVIFILWLYTESFFITCMTFISMLFTIILSFTLYQFLFQIDYFPFLNLLAAVVVVGIGADDLFIYWKTWLAIKLNRNASTHGRIVSSSFRHASAAMFVTSASTATAFYACAYTDIVSIRCFTIYAGTCVIVHYVMCISWLPACVLLYEKYSLSMCSTATRPATISKYINYIHSCQTAVTKAVLERLTQISTWPFVWLPTFALLSTGAAIALFCSPKLSPPSSDMFQVLSAHHPFEVFDMKVRNKFEVTSHRGYLPVIFVFGVNPQYNGQYFNMASKGSLDLFDLPDLASENAQLWFSDFCYELRQQQFFDNSQHQPVGCFIEELRASLRFKPCSIDPVCCERLTFPYNSSVFLHCLKKWSTDNSVIKLHPMDAGIRYRGEEPVAIIISFWSNVEFDYNYEYMQQFHNNVSKFVEERISSCPASAQCDEFVPFFTTSGGLLFYDVQRILVLSLPTTLLVVIVAASAIIFLTTLNVLLTLSALISISCSIMNTLAVLALIKWQLNILESVIVSLAVGLSMDFPLHVAVAYRIASSTRDRKSRVILSLRHVGGSLTAAMATTLVAGLCMLPTEVLAYTKLGTFLALVATISWLHAMLFMPSLLMCIGPVGTFLQLSLCSRRKPSGSRHLEKTIYSSDDISSELTQPLPSTTSPSHLETVMEEVSEDVELSVIHSPTPLTCLLHPNTASLQTYSLRAATSQQYSRLSPIEELHNESFSSRESSVASL